MFTWSININSTVNSASATGFLENPVLLGYTCSFVCKMQEFLMHNTLLRKTRHWRPNMTKYFIYLATCSGCSLCKVCLSAARSQSAGGARPVSDSLIPMISNRNAFGLILFVPTLKCTMQF